MIKPFGLLLLLLLAAFGPGAILNHIIGFRNRLKPEFYLYAIVLGLGILAQVTLALGAVGVYYPVMAWLLLAAGASVSLIELYLHRSLYQAALGRLRFPERLNLFTLAVFLLLLTGWSYSLLANALVPPFNYDEVAYHLAIPKIYILNHAIVYIPFIPYSNWPLETEMLYTISLLLSSETLAHLITWAAMLLICAGIYLFGRRYFNGAVGILAALMFTATPMVATLAGTSLVELPLTLFTLLAVVTILDYLNSGENYYLVLSALFGGLAASTKLNGAMIPLILGVFMGVVSIARRMSLTQTVRRFIIYGIIAFAVVFPWFLKSWILTGNPFWPFFYQFIPSKNWDALGAEYLFGFIRNPNMSLTLRNWLLGFWEISIHPAAYGPARVTLGESFLVLLPLALPAFFFYKTEKLRMLGLLFLIGVIFYTNWFFQTHQTRFFMPVVPVLACVCAASVAWLWSIGKGRFQLAWQISIMAILVFFFASRSWLINPDTRAVIAGNLPYLKGEQTREEYIADRVQGYETYVYANNNLPKDAYVWLALYESRGYYLDRDYMWANPISQRAFPLEKYHNADELAAGLIARGFTHILFRNGALERFTYITYGNQITQLTLDLLASPHVKLIKQFSELELYELVP